jgi:hypothetical protein
VTTTSGEVRLRRRYFVCRSCGLGCHLADQWLGLEGSLSRHALRLATLAAASWSFDRASALLWEFCGLRLSDDTIRSHSLEAARQVRQWQRQTPVLGEAFQRAAGAVEFSSDGTSVNTLHGWREMRLAVFAKRVAGKPSKPAQWDSRTLPSPTCRVLFGGLWTAEQYGPQWRAWAGRLGIRQTEEITVLADGAKWIWNQVEQNLPGAQGVLDIYHAGEHLHGTAKVLFGEGACERSAWVEARRQTLLEGGSAALRGELQAEQDRSPTAAQRSSVQELLDYLEPHEGHTGYRERLARGQSIGSGMIEGACKTVVGKRLKQAGARWRVRHAERMAVLCGVLYGDHWDAYWESRDR